MKNIIFTIIFLCTIVYSYAQTGMFRYQGVARNAQNTILINQDISLRITILNQNNSAQYSESHKVKTSDLGIFSVSVCGGTLVGGNCNTINWLSGQYSLKVEMDITGGSFYQDMGTSPILAVPLASYAAKAQTAIDDKIDDADANPTNELQTIGFDSVTNRLSLTQGNTVNLTVLRNDPDSDPLNEIQTMTFDSAANRITLNKNGGAINLPNTGASLWKKTGNDLTYNHTANIGIIFNPTSYTINFGPTVRRNFTSSTNRWTEELYSKPGNLGGNREVVYGSMVNEYPVTYTQHYLRLQNDTMNYTRLSAQTVSGGGGITNESNEFLMLNTLQNGANSVRILGNAMVSGGGTASIFNALRGRPGAALTGAIVNGVLSPYVGVFDPNNPNSLVGGIYHNGTQSVLAVNVKNFWMDHPRDKTKEIWYACIEGPEAAAYTRGTATLVNGEAHIPFPEHFELVVNPTTMTFNLTPLSAESEGLAVIEKTPTGFKVKELRKGTGNYSFDWEVKGVRKGLEDMKVIRTKGVDTPVPVNIGASSTSPEIHNAFKVQE